MSLTVYLGHSLYGLSMKGIGTVRKTRLLITIITPLERQRL